LVTGSHGSSTPSHHRAVIRHHSHTTTLGIPHTNLFENIKAFLLLELEMHDFSLAVRVNKGEEDQFEDGIQNLRKWIDAVGADEGNKRRRN